MKTSIAFTLVELLLAVALLTIVAMAGVSWAVAQQRSGARIAEHQEVLRQVLHCRSIIHDDLLLGVAIPVALRPDASGVLVVDTLRRIPGMPPGRSTVTWMYEGSRKALIRRTHGAEGQADLIAIPSLAAAGFRQDDVRGLVLEVTPLTSEPISVVLRWGR